MFGGGAGIKMILVWYITFGAILEGQSPSP